MQPESDKGSFVHGPPDSAVRIVMDFGVVDRISASALRGLGALPRRGIEVGGLLLGQVETGPSGLTVRVENCAEFTSEHLYGPNFQLSPRDRQAFAELAGTFTPQRSPSLFVVGIYRSHTRGDLELTAEDVELLDSLFPQTYATCLLLRPFAMKPGEAAFFVRRDGVFQPGPPAATFQFRRKELGGGATPRGSAGLPAPAAAGAPAPAEPLARSRQEGSTDDARPAVEAVQEVEPAPEFPLPAPRGHPGWLWFGSLPVFLLVGVLIGVQVSGGLRKPAAAPPVADPYALGLSALQFGDTIHFRWNPEAPAIHSCRSASLVIRDGDNIKILDLGKEDLARGMLIYRYISPEVSFRLEAVLSPSNILSESLQLRLLPPGGGSSGTPAPIR